MPELLPASLVKVIETLGTLPGVGARTAERYALYLLRMPDATSANIARALTKLHQGVKLCPVTFALIDSSEDVSPLYSDPSRDKTLVAVVEDPLDVVAIERTNQFKGTYHVLGGAISPIDGITPDKLHIPELISRIEKDDVKEVILATNGSVEGESTALFVQAEIKAKNQVVAVSRLARGIPVGIDLEYADQITLSHALEGRKQLN